MADISDAVKMDEEYAQKQADFEIEMQIKLEKAKRDLATTDTSVEDTVDELKTDSADGR